MQTATVTTNTGSTHEVPVANPFALLWTSVDGSPKLKALLLERLVLLNGYKICTDACNAFLALADVVDFLISAPRAHVEPSSLDNLVERFLELFVHAFGFGWMTPKFHWLLHFGEHLKKWHILLNCFVLERRHRISKKVCHRTEKHQEGC